ncbi:hypothetical protein O0L34_g5399 [Tuta absoluta]|nr:hypothetical protein O0L34_g5399 [Tuta absoluta]
MAPPIPDRWIPYKACGKVIEGTRIICFKVPLRKAVQVGKSDIKEIWDIKTLIETIPKLGAVIDLTNTARYYDPRELVQAGILHQKILMPGRIIPPEDKVKQFMDAVDEFLGRDCEVLVGVHCTHGLNRTGYMVCRYMRDRLNIPAKTAIKRFEKARGYEIERENYIADLLGKVPPPPDLNFRSKTTEVRPIDDVRGRRLSTPEEKKDRQNRGSRRNGRQDGAHMRFGSDDDTGGSSRENWRTEPRSSANEDSRGAFDKWNKKRDRSKRRTRTDSERSFDFRHDY